MPKKTKVEPVETVEVTSFDLEVAGEPTPETSNEALTVIEGEVTKEEADAILVSAELSCMVQGAMIGAAAVLIISGKEEEREAETISFLKKYIFNLIRLGLKRDTVGFLWAQMNIAADLDRDNTVQNVACYLLGCVLEEKQEPVQV